jgi:hypothetical protein
MTMPKISKERREFIKKSVLGTAGAAYLWSSGQVFAQSPNENLQIAIIGLGGRSYALAKAAGLTGKLHVRSCLFMVLRSGFCPIAQ